MEWPMLSKSEACRPMKSPGTAKFSTWRRPSSSDLYLNAQPDSTV